MAIYNREVLRQGYNMIAPDLNVPAVLKARVDAQKTLGKELKGKALADFIPQVEGLLKRFEREGASLNLPPMQEDWNLKMGDIKLPDEKKVVNRPPPARKIPIDQTFASSPDANSAESFEYELPSSLGDENQSLWEKIHQKYRKSWHKLISTP